MDTYDYRVNDNIYDSENNRLLDDEGDVNQGLRDPQAKRLAALASTVHQHESHLTDDQIEKVVIWLKRIKQTRQGPSRWSSQGYAAFYRELEALKTKPEQVKMQKDASWAAVRSNLLSLVVLACVLLFLLLYNLETSKWWSAIPGMLGWYSFDMMQEQTKKSFVIAKEQDRRYFMESMRLATNIDELNEAGFFMHFKAMQIDKSFDQEASKRTACQEIQRMRDAIYTGNPFE